MKCITYTLDS